MSILAYSNYKEKLEMSSEHLEKFIQKLPEDASLLGIDVGKKTLGLATGNLLTRTSAPHSTIKRTKFKQDVEQLKAVLVKYSIDALVVGYPLNMDGSEGRQCQSIRDFVSELVNHGIDLPHYFQDERLSTVAVDFYVDKSMGRRKLKEKGLIDSSAAAHILETTIDHIYNAEKCRR